MLSIQISWAAVFIAALINMVLGALWYSPLLFGNVWLKLVKIDRKKMDMKKGARRGYIVSALMSVVMAIVLSLLIQATGSLSPLGGAMIGLLIWVGFCVTMMISPVLWENKPLQGYAINIGYHLVSLVAMGAVIGAFA